MANKRKQVLNSTDKSINQDPVLKQDLNASCRSDYLRYQKVKIASDTAVVEADRIRSEAKAERAAAQAAQEKTVLYSMRVNNYIDYVEKYNAAAPEVQALLKTPKEFWEECSLRTV